MRKLVFGLFGLALMGLAPGAASALTFSPTIMFDVVGGNPGTAVNELGTMDTSGANPVWSLTQAEVIEGVTIESWTAELKEDPFVTNNIVVTNNTGVTQTFVATVLLPIPAFAYNQVISSSFGVTVTDSNSDGVISFAQSGITPMYQGIINGVTGPAELELNTLPSNPLTLADCPAPFAGCTALGGNGVASQAAGPGVANSIALTLTFALSAGDSAGITSRFEIIPEPGTILLVSLGIVGLAVAGRRRA